MRASILCAALTAALSITMASPSRADAQVFLYPNAGYSPYAYSGYMPGYNYAYTWTNPYYSTYSSTWANPYNYGSWSWYTPNYYGYGGMYGGFNGVPYYRPVRPRLYW
jgi:hypothetical protein